MFSIQELSGVRELPAFQQDLASVRLALAHSRIGRPLLFSQDTAGRLADFVEAVLASAPQWGPQSDADLCRIAAEIAELLASLDATAEDERKLLRWRCALLYELSDLPALASAVLESSDVTGLLDDMILRRGPFEIFQEIPTYPAVADLIEKNSTPLDLALSQDAFTLASLLQGERRELGVLIAPVVEQIAKHLSIGMTATECEAFEAVIHRRADHATRTQISDDTLFESLRSIHFPAELWSAQIKAIAGGLLDPSVDSWGFAAPTGTGKTYLTRVLILDTLRQAPDAKVLYIVPSKALVHEVASKLQAALALLEFRAVAVTPQLVDMRKEEENEVADADVVVLTPEKADLLLRLGEELFGRVALIIVDEAHHIESGTRGILLELYLWRIKHLLHRPARIVFLSAVAPNIDALTSWMGNNPASVVDSRRSTRMRAGIYGLHGTGRKRQGRIDYSDGTSVLIVPERAESGKRAALTQLAAHLAPAGPVLVVSKGKGECEQLARAMLAWLRESGELRPLWDSERNAEEVQRLDSRLEREMYSDVPMRELIRYRIAYHHAGLPPRVRIAVEDAIRGGYIEHVFATTTLAEGVNFPFASVIVQSLAIREAPELGRPARFHPVTPRTFWNIAGRAGRPGFDKEGQVILFSPRSVSL